MASTVEKVNPVNKVAVIGSGYFSQFHLGAWQRIEGVTVSGLYTLDAYTGFELCQRFSLPTRYDSLEALIADAPDLVDVVIPPEAQYAVLKKLADKGIACICQKPFCANLKEAQEISAYFGERNVELIIHENFRHQPWYRAIRKELDGNLLGTPYQATFRLRPGDGQGDDAYLERQPYFREQPEFLVRETAIHFIDVFRYLFGEIDLVFADLVRLNPVIKGEDAGMIMMRFANGMRGLIDGNRLSDHDAENTRLTMGELCVEGELGELRLDGYGQVTHRAHGTTTTCPIDFSWQENDFAGDCVYLTQQHIVEALRDGKKPENTAADYLVNRTWERCVYQSANQGQWVKADLNYPA